MAWFVGSLESRHSWAYVVTSVFSKCAGQEAINGARINSEPFDPRPFIIVAAKIFRSLALKLGTRKVPCSDTFLGFLDLG